MLVTKVIKHLLRSQQGAIGLLIVIGFMAMGIPLTTSALGLAGALSKDSRVKTEIAKDQYSRIGVAEYVRVLMSEPEVWNDWLDDTGGEGQLTINDEEICFSTTQIVNPDKLSPKSEIKVKKNSTLTGDLVSGGSKVKIEKDAVITGNIRAGGKEVKLEKDSVVYGNIWANGDVILKNNAHVYGDVTAGGTITLEQGAWITGETTLYTTPAYIVPVNLLTLDFLAPGADNVTVDKNDPPLDLAPYSYAKLKVKKDATILFSSGHYSFKEFHIDKDAIINFDSSAGDITIDVNDKKFHIHKNAQMVMTDGSGDILFRAQNKMDLHKDGIFIGTYLTTGGPMTLVTVTNCDGVEFETYELWYGGEEAEEES